jgi:hypothetical protein
MPNSTSGLDNTVDTPRFCSFCGHPVVVADATFCKDCGRALGPGLRWRHDLAWNPWTAAALSIIPGLGHFYKGERWQAMAWLVGVLIAYSAYPFGLLAHLICATNAALSGVIEFPSLRLPRSGAGGRQAGHP